MISYQKENSGLEIRYSLEYIDNKKDFDYISSGKFSRGEPWERYKKKAYSSLDEAMSYYVLYLFNPQIYAVKLFEEVLIDGETVREAYIEPIPTLKWTLKKILNQDLNRANEKIEDLEKVNSLNQGFIDFLIGKYGKSIKEMYGEYVKEREGE